MMKAIVYGYSGDKHVTLGEIRLRGKKLVYAVSPDAGNHDRARDVLSTMIRESMGSDPKVWLKYMPHMYSGSYLRAKFVDDLPPTPPRHGLHWPKHFEPATVAKEFNPDQARDESGKWTSGGGSASAHQAAADYMKSRGETYTPPTKQPYDEKRAAQVADAYDKMPNTPNDPETLSSYHAMADEAAAQYHAMEKTGMKVEAVAPGQPDPYKNADEMIKDAVENNHMWYYPTTSGFGPEGATADQRLPMLQDSGIKDANGRPMLKNDVFRVVHDYFGHVKDNNSFRPEGEEAAWQSHSGMFSPKARRVMTTETRGQTNWVYWGPYGAQNRAAKDSAGVRFADQKIGLLPEEYVYKAFDESEARDESGKWTGGGAKLSDHQADIVAHVKEHGGKIVRKPGGFWHAEGSKMDAKGVPEKWTQVQTIRALEAKGVLERTHEFPEEWKDSRRVVTKAFDESEHPRDDAGKFSEAGGAGIARTDWQASPAPETFIAERDKNPRADFMSHLNPEDLKDSKIILSKDGLAGATVAPDGDIQNVFRNPGAPKGSGTAAALEGVKHGGVMLDCYDYERKGREGLPDVYRKAGFVETGRMKFNPTYRPEWAGQGRTPDVVFMAYVGGDQSTSPKSDRYYGSTEWDKAKADSAKTAAKAAEPQWSKSKDKDNEYGYTIRHGGKRYEVYHDRQSGSWRSLELLSVSGPGGSPVDFIGHNKGDVMDRIKSGRYDNMLDQHRDDKHFKTFKAEITPLDEENKKIEENKKRWQYRTHKFAPADFTAGNGHPRCIRCGDEEPVDGFCMPSLKKWERVLTAWTQKFENTWNGKIETGETMSAGWITQFHSACIEKGAVCKVAWPACPVGKSDSVAKYITGHNGTFQVHAESGKVLGTHDTKADAEAQLRAIEANKHGTGKDVQWPVTPKKPGYGNLPVEGEKAPNQKSEEIAPDDATIDALKSAWQAFAKSIGLVFKSEDVMAEPIESNVFRIEAAGKRAYFRAENGTVERIEYHRKDAFVTVQKSEKQRYTLGAVYAPGEVDFHGDTMTEAELEKAAWAFAKKDGLTKRVGLQHQSGTDGAGDIVESYIYRGPEWKFKDTKGNAQTIVPGTWMLGTVWTPEAWTKIERGAVNGYSLQGVARKFANGEEV